MTGRRGFWLVLLMLFGPLVAIVILQFTSDENRYIPPTEALQIAANEQGLDEPPEEWDLKFDNDPSDFPEVSAVWKVTSPDDVEQELLIDMVIDAETGDVLGFASFAE